MITLTLQDALELDSWADHLYKPVYQSLLQYELAQLWETKLKGKFFSVYIGETFIRITVFSRVDEAIERIKSLIGDEYLVKRALPFSHNIMITVKP